MRRWDTVAIIGVGLLGGSIGLALRRRKLAKQVIGIGRRRSSLAKALSCGCVTSTTTSIPRGVGQAQLVIVATPVEMAPQHLAEAAACAPGEALFTDVGSTKAELVAQTEAALLALENHEADGGLPFVGSHPLAGSEKTGPEFARADLLEGRVIVMTPTAKSRPAAVAAIDEFWKSLGGRVVRMSPDEHDAALARTSHLPHLLAAVLAAGTPEGVLPLTATGWHDTTRVAGGDAELWRQILLANRGHTLLALADFEKVLSEFRAALESNDGPQLAALLAEGKRRRDAVGN